MAPQHGRRRARIAFSDSAAKPLENLTSEAQIHALDRALVVDLPGQLQQDAGEALPAGFLGYR
jgi:hypothetical protein